MHPLAEAEALHSSERGEVAMSEREKARLREILPEVCGKREAFVCGASRYRGQVTKRQVLEWERDWRDRLRGLELAAYGRAITKEW